MLPSRNDSLLSQVLLNLNLNVLCPIKRSWMLIQTLSNFHPKSFHLSGEEDAPGGQADGTPKPHNINRKKACIKFKLRIIFCKHSNPIQFQHLFADTPILGSRMPMRRETLKAIETARDNLMQVLLFLPTIY